MKLDRYKIALLILFLIVFSLQVYFSFQSKEFSHESYYHLRHIEHIQSNYLPLYQDPLSYQGRDYNFPPLFHYLMAGIGSVIGLQLTAKIIPPLLSSLLIFIVYEIAFKITSNKNYGMLSAAFFSFTPITFTFPINNISPFSLAIPLLFGIIYLLTDLKNLNLMLILIIALVFTHPSAVILLLGLICYMILLKLEGMKVERKNTEIIIFTMFLVFWALFIIYKDVFLTHGLSIVWQNVPSDLLASTFKSLTVLDVIYLVGAIPLLLGSLAAYDSVMKHTDKRLLLLMGFMLAVLFLLWFNFVRAETGMLYLSILLCIFSSYGMKIRMDYLDKTRIADYTRASAYTVIFFFMLSTFPVFGTAMDEATNTPLQSEIDAMVWLRNNIDSDSTILIPLKQGHVLTYFAKRKNVADTNFVLIKNADEKVRDVENIYKFRLISEAVGLMNENTVDYLFFGPTAKQSYAVELLWYTDDANCFTRIYDEDVQIYKVHCTLGENEI